MTKKYIFSLLILSLLISPLNFSSAAQVTFYETNVDFNPNNIISDSALGSYNSMTVEQIKEFVNNKGGTLGSYIDPQAKLPAYFVIWQTAQEFRINPKFILTMLQKEQSLVTDTNPSTNQYDWAVGYSCYGGICLDKYQGFSTQIRAMANKIVNGYMADLNTIGKYKENYGCTFTMWCVGFPKETQDQQLIIPQNKITAALYTYNPYRGGTIMDGYKIGANYNFWKIWNNWFSQDTFRPGGALLKSALSDTVYLIQNGKKRPFKTFSSLVTRYDPENIIIVDQAELDAYESGEEIKFAQYSLLSNSAGAIYLLVDESLRQIESMEVFRTLGFNPEEIEQVADADLDNLKIGQPITLNSAYPTGALITDSSSGGVYFVQNGIKYPIFSREILKVNFPDQTILAGHSEELEKYPKGDAIKFKDGTLVKSFDNGIVYVISEGRKLPIVDEESFLSRGYVWDKIVSTSATAVDIHPTGETLEAIDSSLLPKTPEIPAEESGSEIDLPADSEDNASSTPTSTDPV